MNRRENKRSLLTASQHDASVGSRLLNWSQICVCPPHAPTAALLLPTTPYLNINLMPLCSRLHNPSAARKEQCVVFSGVSSTFESNICTLRQRDLLFNSLQFYIFCMAPNRGTLQGKVKTALTGGDALHSGRAVAEGGVEGRCCILLYTVLTMKILMYTHNVMVLLYALIIGVL